MAIDTVEKRFSMLNFGGGNHWHLSFEADGAVDQDDRQHLLDCYSGILFADPTPVAPGDPAAIAARIGKLNKFFNRTRSDSGKRLVARSGNR